MSLVLLCSVWWVGICVWWIWCGCATACFSGLGFVSGYVVCYWFVWVVVVDNLVLEFVLGVGGGFSGLDLALDGASMWLL